MLMSILKGAAAGAAGTTALNATTYLDMTVRARPTSSTPEDTVEKLAEISHIDIPGEGEERDNRVAGLGPLSGITTGVGIGALLGLSRALGWLPSALWPRPSSLWWAPTVRWRRWASATRAPGRRRTGPRT
jgi:hypothetical protein